MLPRVLAAATMLALLLPITHAKAQNDPATVRGPLTATEWVQLVGGKLQARVVTPLVDGRARAIADARVFLLGREGVSYRGVTDEKGDVAISSVRPGVYAMITQGRGVVAVYAIHVLAPDYDNADLYPSRLDIACGPISYLKFLSTISPYLEPTYTREELSIDDADLEALLPQLRNNETLRVTRNDGGLIGYLYKAADNGEADDDDDEPNRPDPAAMMNVIVLADDKIVGRDLTDQDGRFEISSLQTGIYTLIGVGPDGVMAVGFELVDPVVETSRAQVNSDTGHRFVTRNANETRNEFGIQCIPVTMEELKAILELPEESPIPFDRYGIGSSGTVGGGFDGGGIAGLAVLAAAIAAAVDDDDAAAGLPIDQPASPFVP